jgi:hypothetical protein
VCTSCRESTLEQRAIPVVVLTGLSQTNAARLQGDGACAFLTKADIALDQGVEPLLAALREIVKKLLYAPSCAGLVQPA